MDSDDWLVAIYKKLSYVEVEKTKQKIDKIIKNIVINLIIETSLVKLTT